MDPEADGVAAISSNGRSSRVLFNASGVEEETGVDGYTNLSPSMGIL